MELVRVNFLLINLKNIPFKNKHSSSKKTEKLLNVSNLSIEKIFLYKILIRKNNYIKIAHEMLKNI